MVLCFIITAVVDFLRQLLTQKQTFPITCGGISRYGRCLCGRGDALVAAGGFAQSLSTIGFITNLIDSAQSFGGSAFFMMLVLAGDYHFSHHGDGVR